MSEETKSTIPESEVLNMIMQEAFKQLKTDCFDFMKAEAAKEYGDYTELLYRAAGIKALGILIEVLTKEHYSFMKVSKPPMFQETMDANDQMIGAARVNLDAYAQFYKQNVKRISS